MEIVSVGKSEISEVEVLVVLLLKIHTEYWSHLLRNVCANICNTNVILEFLTMLLIFNLPGSSLQHAGVKEPNYLLINVFILIAKGCSY